MLGFISSLGAAALNTAANFQASTVIALFLVAVLTEVGVPFPFVLDTAVLFVGYQAGFFSVRLLALMLVLFLGGVVGSGLVYLLARLLGSQFLNLLGRRFAGLPNSVRHLSSTLSSRRAPLAIAVARLTPGLLIPVSVASGCMRLPFQLFVLGLGLASLIIDMLLITVGLITRHALDSRILGPSPILVAFGLAILISVAGASSRLIGRRRSRVNTKGRV